VTVSGLDALKNRLVPGLIDGRNSVKLPVSGADEPEKGKFTDMVKDLLQSVNESENDAAQAQDAFLDGQPVELHQVMIKAEEAGISLDLLLEIRNKLVDAYNTVMRMPM
jgi:flagellar hook-basal body complex protein FliE